MAQSVDGSGQCLCVCVCVLLYFALSGTASSSGISQMMYYYIQAFLESAAHVCKEDGQLATCTCYEYDASRVIGLGTSCRSGHAAPSLWQRLLL